MTSVLIPRLEDINREILRIELEDDLLQYLKWVFEKIYKQPFYENWHHKAICKVLTKVYLGELIHVIINLPPRYTKTELVIKAFVSWSLAKNINSKFLHLSYSDDLALDNSSKIKEIILHDEYQALWPMKLKDDSQSKKKWFNEQGGGLYAAAAGGALTGFGAGSMNENQFEGAILIDDPLKPDDAKSDTLRKAVNDRFNETIKSRGNSKKTPIIIIMQRLHEDDLSGFLLNGGSEFDFFHLNLPALNEHGPNEYDPREIGQALWPRKHSELDLENMRKSSAMVFAGQYQQRPAPQDGNIFKNEGFYFYKTLPMLNLKIQSWDFTFKKSKKSDYVVGTLWGRDANKNKYLIDLVRKKMTFSESLETMKSFNAKHLGCHAVLVEAKANGEAIIDSVKGLISRVVPISPTSSKVERAEAIAPAFLAGEVFLPDPSIAPWVNDFINELKVFPNGTHDDQVDSTTQALEFFENLNVTMLPPANSKKEPFRKSFEKRKAKDAFSSRIAVRE